MNKLKVSLVQSELFWENIDSNLKMFESKIMDSEKPDIFILPEMFNTGFTNNVENCYETPGGKTINWMRNIAHKTGSAICGSMIFKDNNKIFNRFVFVYPDKNIVYYNKKHLFGIGGESSVFTAGDKKVIIEFGSFKILLLVCYDLRFPVWSRNTDNYDIIIYTANWPDIRRNTWDVLLKARAIENQCYVIGVNRVGVDGNGLHYDGGSCIIDPGGTIITSANDNKEQIITGILDKVELEKFRIDFPVLKDMDSFSLCSN